MLPTQCSWGTRSGSGVADIIGPPQTSAFSRAWRPLTQSHGPRPSSPARIASAERQPDFRRFRREHYIRPIGSPGCIQQVIVFAGERFRSARCLTGVNIEELAFDTVREAAERSFREATIAELLRSTRDCGAHPADRQERPASPRFRVNLLDNWGVESPSCCSL